MRSIKLAILVLGLTGSLAGCGNIDDLEAKPCQEPGAEGCECTSSGRCDLLPDGTRLMCVDDACVAPTCPDGEPGGAGCMCDTFVPCGGGHVCVNGLCEVDTGQTLVPPASPRCYTPCQGGFTNAEGQYVPCSDEGLLEGCIDSASCLNGTCVSSAARRSDLVLGACEVDSDCPDFQVCIDNQCYSDCTVDADCRGNRQCHRAACRLPCSTADEDPCPAGSACSVIAGDEGFCMPVAEVDGVIVPVEEGGFEVSDASFELSNTLDTATFTIRNDSPTFKEFVVRKVSHTEYSGGNSVTVDEFPLHWVTLGVGSAAPEQVQEVVVGIDGNGGAAEVVIANATNSLLSRWEGIVEISERTLGTRSLRLSYTGSAEGRWSGRVYYLANFGDRGLEDWAADRTNRTKLSVVGNAFIRRWGAFRDRRISLDEFLAALNAVETGAWQFNSVKERCPTADDPNPNVACYLANNPAGISILSDFVPDNPVPSGVADFPVAMNLRAPDPEGAPGVWTGRIVSDESLQFAGDPAVRIVFQNAPGSCSVEHGDLCLTYLDQFDAEVLVGGRYLTNATDASCERAAAGTFQHYGVPWLVPGFEKGSDVNPSTGTRYRYECRDQLLPYGADEASRNASFASSNPIPDGGTRRRTIELIDGALIDQDTMVIIFRERFSSFLSPGDSEGFMAYGYMRLVRSSATLAETDYVGNEVSDARPAPGIEVNGCTDDLVDAVLGGATLGPANAGAVAQAVVTGMAPTSAPPPAITPSHPESVHYYCEDTGTFDEGYIDSSGLFVPTPCPQGSRVRYFTLQGPEGRDLSDEPCQRTAECQDTLNRWDDNGEHSVRLDPSWECETVGAVLCDRRDDLRVGKRFYGAEVTTAVFQPLDSIVQEAFRYKTKFRDRSGGGIGFAPDVCIPGSSAVPYCYDPPAIEEIRDRVDCATHLYTDYYDDLDLNTRSLLKRYLQRSFAYSEEFVFGLATPIVIEGFERLYAELLIMQGDEAFTTAFASRFDLAGMNIASFEGAAFEPPSGINLSGGAGYEMFNLYLATQYYQMALDRFYRLSPLVWRSIDPVDGLPPGQGFITQGTVVAYFDRLIRASSQKARAWSEVAKRYQSFNRPDLARTVVRRAYVSAYLESIVLSRMMLRVVEIASAEDRAQIVRQVELAQNTYRAALLDMKNVFDDITDDVTVFGFAPDFIPFPAMDPGDTNAFEKVLARAWEKVELAKAKEERALEDSRSFDTDSALFQAELAGIQGDYENQLGDICGTFVVDTGAGPVVYPAIPKYAHLHPVLGDYVDICGLVGNGDLHDAFIELRQARLEFAGIRQAASNLGAAAVDLSARTSEQCGRVMALKDFIVTKRDEITDLQRAVNDMNAAIDGIDRGLSAAATIAELIGCSVGLATDCPTKSVAMGVYIGVTAAAFVTTVGLQAGIVAKEEEIADAETAIVGAELEDECTALQIDTKYDLREIYRESLEVQLEALRVQYGVELAMSQIQKLRNAALSLISEQESVTQLAVNVEAARNDPNVRIFRNDAVRAADRTFFAALREAYRATKVYEYYTSQSYAELVKLPLVRMVANGDFTLEAYLAELEEAFLEFEQEYGNPDTRVAILSLRDDLLRIPRLSDDGVALTEQQRTALLRERMRDVSLLDERGYVSIPFSTSLGELSPLTRNHKILYMEAEIVGDEVGDQLGRVYVSQLGTGVVRSVAGDDSFFAFPERTAVLDAFFNGERALPADVYRSERLRDRPFVNTGWQLVFNQKDEAVNADIPVEGLSDVRLYVFYTDFTEL